MTITRESSSWFGTEQADIQAYLEAIAAEGYPVQEVVDARCSACGGNVFDIEIDDDEGYVLRSCAGCGERFEMLDSADVAEEAEIGDAQCPCGSEQFEIAVGFALREDQEIRWVYVGARCVADGQLGVYADWKIDYSPSRHLLQQV
ncbi:hypothetical protein [Nocardioides jejuensis]|uniref:Uncharacterized protein n=1 Tax=Nocardioides jejuensis TaxID=2502782 RepID=A0A4V2NZY3_9ACTN|nr:hypothetical protein [Nocardioides jejuensis]TCJ30782.1 hypothetical protein EPD65_01730 [Nocardioides jejuensis]